MKAASLRNFREMNRFALFKLLSILLIPVFFLSGCLNKDEEESFSDRPVEALYNEAVDELEKGNFTRAAKKFTDVEQQHPYSDLALHAQINGAHAYYQAKKYDEAIEGFTVFMRLHPSHPDVAYAQYMLGICAYEQMPIVERDQKTAEQALSAFEDVVRRFPTSAYAKDAKIKVAFIQNHLSGKEMDIGRYYQSQKSYLAAINRFKDVINRFQTTAMVPEALHRLVECNLALGLVDEAQRLAAVLGHNYPNNQWYVDTYNLMKSRNAGSPNHP